MRLWQRAMTGLAAASAAAVLAPAAMASITPALVLNQNPAGGGGGSSAGAFQNLGLDLQFPNSTDSDSPQNLTISLPPGLLANTSLTAADGSECIQDAPTGQPDMGCQIGTGTVAADAVLVPGVLTVPLSVAVQYYLVAPPSNSSGDIAGIEVYNSTATAGVIPALGQVGSTGDILIRPTGDPAGVGATIKLTLPDTAMGIPLEITDVNSIFTSLRYPATCPATPQNVAATVDSYGDPTVHDLSAQLPVTGCSSLPYSPHFAASATRDSGDGGVAVTTDITQAPTEAPNSAVSLTFPSSMFGPNLNTIKNLCVTPSTSACDPVGSVTATSPLYPTALSGSAYLVGGAANGGTASLKLVFPAPFPLTLTGAVNLTTNSASFTGLPDIPLTDLKVTLRGGSDSLFVATCQASAGTATASLSSQTGVAANLSAPITYTGCPADNPPKGTSTGTGTGTGTKSGTGNGSGTGTGSSSGAGGATTVAPTATAELVSQSISGLAKGKPSLTFKVAAGKKAAKLTRLTIKLPSGLSFRSHRKGKKHLVKGIALRGTASRSATLTGQKLVVVFKTGSRKVTVRLGTKALKESEALRAKAQKKALKSLVLRVTARNAKHKSKALKAKITKLNLG